MTVSSSTSRIEQAGDGVTVAFTFPYYFLTTDDLVVYVDETLQSAYSVTGAGNPSGGTVTFTTAPADETNVVIFRDPAVTQELDYAENDPFPAETHELGLDKGTMIDQRTRELAARSIHVADFQVGVDATLPALVADSVVVVNGDATGFTLATQSELGDVIDFVQGGTGAVPRLVNEKARERISPKDFGAVGDGETDDTAAIQLALNYAKTLVDDAVGRTAWGGNPVVDGGGLTYLVTDSISMDQLGGVTFQNFKLVADPDDWPGATTYVIEAGSGTGGDDRYISIRDGAIECSHVANGVDWNNIRSATMQDVHIHGFTNYGLREHGSQGGDCMFTRVRCGQWWFNEDDFDDVDERTGVGISDEVGDNKHIACEAFYCAIPIDIQNAGSHVHIGGHSFNGAADPPSWTITGVAGSGGHVRITVASTSGLITGDLVCVPWLPGVSSDAGGGRAGVYAATVINGTTVDFAGYAFITGPYSGSGQTFIKYEDEPINVRVQDGSLSVIFTGGQIDNGKFQIIATKTVAGPTVTAAQVSINGMLFLKSAAGSNRCGVEMISDGTLLATCESIQVTGCYFAGAYPPFRMTSLNSGTFATIQQSAIRNNARKDGAAAPVFGKTVMYGGTVTSPGTIFTADPDNQSDTDAVLNDANTGMYYIGADDFGVATGGAQVARFTAAQSLLAGKGQLANNATGGFLYIPTTTDNQPTGAPTSYSGWAAVVYDDTNDILFVRGAGGWRAIATVAYP